MATPGLQLPASSRERSNGKEDSVERADSGQNNQQDETETQEYNSSSEEESEYDEEEDEKMRTEFLEDMNCLEKYFTGLREMLYSERMLDLDIKQQLVDNETAPEYLEQLQDLERSLDQSRKAAMKKRDHCRQVAQLRYDEEEKSARAQLKEDCKLVLLQMKSTIEEQMRRLREEHVLTELSDVSARKRGRLEFPEPAKRRKPANINGPYVVYMLKETDISEDLEALRQGRAKAIARQRYCPEETGLSGFGDSRTSLPRDGARNRVVMEDGEICCNRQCFCLESSVLVERANNHTFEGVIKSIDSHEVTVLGLSGVVNTIQVADIKKSLYSLKPPLTHFPAPSLACM